MAVNLDAHELAAWDKEKARFRGTPQARLDAFRKWAHEHPREIHEAVERESEAKLAKMIRDREKLRDVAVPCRAPYRVRIREACMASERNPRKKKAAKRRAKDRARRLSDERLRKAAEKRSRRTAKGDATRKRRRRANPEAETSAAKALYRKLHWGIPAEKVETMFIPSVRAGESVAALGRLVRLEYETAKGLTKRGKKRAVRVYFHDHEHPALLCVTADKELVIAKTSARGGYTVTEHGIEG